MAIKRTDAMAIERTELPDGRLEWRFSLAESGSPQVDATLSSSNRHPDLNSLSFSSVDLETGVLSFALDIAKREGLKDVLMRFPSGSPAASSAVDLGLVGAAVSRSGTIRSESLAEACRSGSSRRLEVEFHEGLSPRLSRIADTIYAEHHRWAGRYEPGQAPWLALVGELAAGGAFLVSDGSGGVALASSHVGPFVRSSSAFIPPVGAAGDVDAAGLLVRAAMSHLAERCIERGLDHLDYEVDSTYTHAFDILDGTDATFSSIDIVVART